MGRSKFTDASGSFFLGLGIGMAAAAAAALLLAPRAGEELRAQVLRSVEVLGERFEKVSERLKESAAHLVEEKRGRLLSAVEAAREEMQRAREEIEARLRGEV